MGLIANKHVKMESANLSELRIQANKEMKHTNNWLIANKLTLNIKKSKYMIIGKKKNSPTEEFSLVLNGTEEMLRCKEYKYLGVIIDDKLTWKSHIQLICEKIGKT